MQQTITVAQIMDCPTITVHAGKHYKALIDSGATISLLQYSTYKNIEDSYKTPLQPTMAKLNTADGSHMTALGMTVLHLQILEFKFTHNFVIGDKLLDTEIIFGIDIPKKFSLSYAWEKEKNCYIQRDGKFLTYMTKLWTKSDNWHRERDPNINIINSIHKIKGKTSVNILVWNYTNKNVTFNKGEYIGCLEPAIMDDMTLVDSESPSTHSITLQKMMAE